MAYSVLDNAFDSVMRPELDELYAKAGKKFNINPLWLKAQDLQELGPGLDHAAAGDAEHRGHGQIGPAWRKKLGLPANYTPEQGVFGMAQIMRELMDKHGGDMAAAHREYIGGPDTKLWGEDTINYPKVIAANYSSLGGTPDQYAYAEGREDLLDKTLDAALKEEPKPIVAPRPNAEWNFNNQVGNALTGFIPEGGVKGRAWMEALQQTATQKFHGGKNFDKIGFNELLQSNYNRNLGDIRAAKQAYETEHPSQSLLGELIGGTVPAVGAMASGNAGVVAPLGRQIVSSFPRAEPVVNFLTGRIPQGAGALQRFGSRIIPGATGGVVSALTASGLTEKPLRDQLEWGAGLGAVMGPIGGAVGDALSSQVAPRVAEQANKLLHAGVPLRAGQIPGVSPIVRFAHKWLDDTSGAAQRTGLAKAASRLFGEDSEVVDNELAKRAQERLTANFKQFGNATIQRGANKELDNSILDIISEAHGEGGIPEDKLKALRDVGSLILGTGDGKTFNGTQFVNFTKYGSDLERLMRDPMVGHSAAKIMDRLFDALEASEIAAKGRWVPAGAATPRNAPAADNTAAGLFPRAVPRNALMGERGGLPATGREPLEGEVFTPPGPPPQPGMVWEIDPQTQGALRLLRDTRGQYKNLKLITGILNDNTAELQPSQLASRVKKFYPPNAQRKPSKWEQDALDLAAGSQFIPNASAHATNPSNKLLTMKHAGVGAGGALSAEGLLHLLQGEPGSIPYVLGAAALGTGAAKGGTALLNSPANTQRIVRNALEYNDYPLNWTSMLSMPPVVQMFNRQEKKSKGAGK